MSAAHLSLRRRLRRRFYLALTRGVLAAAGRLPAGAGRSLCRGLAALAWRIRPRERARARQNLARAFPQLAPPARDRLLRASAAALGETLFATLTADRMAAAGFPGVVAPTDLAGDDAAAACRRALAPGRGAILLTGHIGCWELLGAWLAARLGGLAVVTGTVHNPAVDALVQDRRRALGMEPLPRKAGIRPVLRQLAQGRMVGVLLDQNTRAASVPAPFFGHPAPTPIVVAKLALRRGLAVVPAAMVRRDDCWVVEHLPALLPESAADPRRAEDVVAFTARCNEALQTLIVRNPEQWVWFHRRWDD